MTIRIVSLMAPNADPFYRALVPALAAATGLDVELVEDAPWQARQHRFERGEVEVAFACGVYYTRQVDEGGRPLALLAAPVPAAARYQDRPVYFSDVVVRRNSRFRSFEQLRGACLAYNEPGSHSGYNIVRWHLSRRGLPGTFFGRLIEAGAHQSALRRVACENADAAAIDATVLETELHEHPWLAERLRVIHTLGPSPIPPAIAAPHLPEGARLALREALLDLHHTEAGREILAFGRCSRFAAVTDDDYAPIRRMDRLARAVTLRASGRRRSVPAASGAAIGCIRS
jgi:phosphonate transport system substrate-binding protein